MKFKIPSGVILESDNPEVFEGWLNNGAVEVADNVTSTKPKRQTKKQKEESVE